MAKIGYILSVTDDENLMTDKDWMQQYGCMQIVEENIDDERHRPLWHQLLSRLERGDVVVLSKFSNAVRGVRELSSLIEFCRVKVVRLISLRDRIDTGNELFPETSVIQVMEMFGSLPEEVAVLHNKLIYNKAYSPKKISIPVVVHNRDRGERERGIVAMYNNNVSIDDIMAVSGYKSRSTIFRILAKYGVKLNRGNFSGPLGKRKSKKD